MGVSISSKNYSADLGGGGFFRFRHKVAELVNKEFGQHYDDVRKGDYIFDQKERSEFYAKHDAKTRKMVADGIIPIEIADFCYQSDTRGSIDTRQAKMIYESIKDYDDNICYGYAGRRDCAMFADLKQIFKDGAETRKHIRWY